jgi:hypothetical protein
VARTGFFSRRPEAEDRTVLDDRAAAEQRAADEDRATEADAATERSRWAAAHRADQEQRAADADRAAAGTYYSGNGERTDAGEEERVRIPATTVPRTEADADADRTEPMAARPEPAVVAAPVRAHTSFLAVLGLVVGLTAGYAALTGRLAPVGVAVGVLGLLLSIAAFAAVSRPGVTGHSVALLGLLFSIAGIVLGVMAVKHAVPWLDGGSDQAAKARDWLDARMTWLKRF